MNRFIGAATVAVSLLMGSGFPAAAQTETSGTITIPIKEYEALKKSVEADKEDQFWNMTFEQILDKENNNYARAWEKYEFWTLRHVRLDGPVNDNSVSVLTAKIVTLNEIDSEAPITMYIDSPGGGVLSGLNLINAMNSSKAPINTVCDGWAMSMAAVILSNGVYREANQGCIFMIHEVAVGSPGGKSTEHLKWTSSVVDVENILAGILSENSGLSVKDVRIAWGYETFYNAFETVELGFADVVTAISKSTKKVGSRSLPIHLLPENKMRETFEERLTR